MSQISERNRLSDGLSREDKDVVKSALIDYMLHNDFRASDLIPDFDLCKDLLPIIV